MNFQKTTNRNVGFFIIYQTLFRKCFKIVLRFSGKLFFLMEISPVFVCKVSAKSMYFLFDIYLILLLKRFDLQFFGFFFCKISEFLAELCYS